MANSADPDQLASLKAEANWSGTTMYFVWKGRTYLGSAGQGLNKMFLARLAEGKFLV